MPCKQSATSTQTYSLKMDKQSKNLIMGICHEVALANHSGPGPIKEV